MVINTTLYISHMVVFQLIVILLFLGGSSYIWKIHFLSSNTYKIHKGDILYMIWLIMLVIYLYIYLTMKKVNLLNSINLSLVSRNILDFLNISNFKTTSLLIFMMILGFFIVYNFLVVFRIHILKIYIWCQRWSIIPKTSQKVFVDIIRDFSVKLTGKFIFARWLPYNLSSEVASWYNRKGPNVVFLFILFVHILYDLWFNDGITYATTSFLPYYSMIMFLYNIYSIIIKRTPNRDAIISDAYYRFNSPREEFQGLCLVYSFDFPIKYGHEYDLERHGFGLEIHDVENNPYFAYRITINTPESMSKHILYNTDLVKEEFFRRKKILKEIVLYPY